MEFGKHGLQYYILVDNLPIPAPSLLEWCEWRSKPENCQLKLDRIFDTEISTVFLGLPQNLLTSGTPRGMFETMIFSDQPDLHHLRWNVDTYEQAMEVHTRAKELILTKVN